MTVHPARDDLPRGGATPEVVVRSWEASFAFAGPLPHPEILRGYDEVCPGAADRIIALAESQAEHRQSLERVVISGKDRRATHGLYIGGAIAAVVTVLAFLLVWRGRSVAGFATLIGEAGFLAGVFVYGRTQERREREAKARLTALVPEPSPQLPFPG